MTITGPFETKVRYVCLSTDTKPTDVVVGAEIYETDTGDTYIYSGSAWVEEN
jgi:hypothetical protein